MSPVTQSVATQRAAQIEAALRAIPQGPARTPFYVRAVEIAVALAALTLTSPILLVMAVLIRRGSPGPALFWQDRIGRNGKLFKFVKFRTLYADAKQRWPELYAYDYNEQELEVLKYKTEEDPRVTPQGKWMRFTSLDELPNFWNLFKGEVALVGPRPEIPEMLPYYEAADLRKFSVRPGITGLAQISGRARLEFRRVVAYDVEYVDRHSLLLDIKILAKTFHKIVTREGAYCIVRHKLQDGSEMEREDILALTHLACDAVPARGSLVPANVSEPALRMAVRLKMTLADGERVLAITSPSARDFASELATALAMAFSQTEQGEVVLVSATQGNPASVVESSGLGEVLSGACGLPAAISPPRGAGPFVLSRGWLPPNPVSLFSAPECAQLFAALRERFRVIVVDAGPISSPAAMALIARCDAVALAVAKGAHRRRELIEIQEELALLKARTLGVILTGNRR